MRVTRSSDALRAVPLNAESRSRSTTGRPNSADRTITDPAVSASSTESREAVSIADPSRPESVLLRRVLERELDPGPEQQRPVVADYDVLLRHLADAEVVQRSRGRTDGFSGRLLPGRGTRADDVDHSVNAHLDPSILDADESILIGVAL